MNAKELYDNFLAETQDPFQAAYLTLAESNLILAASNQGIVDESSPLKKPDPRLSKAIRELPGINMTLTEGMISVQEAARQMGVAATTVYALCSARKLPHKRIGQGRGVVRIRQCDLDVFMAQQTTDVPAMPPAEVAGRHDR